jgi:hypothetical protein
MLVMKFSTSESKHLALIEQFVNSEFETVSVPIQRFPFSKERDCYENVDKAIALHGGQKQYGWAVIENELFIEAIHHAVWENQEEELVDVTKWNIPGRRILFIPDDRIEYDGRIVESILMNITGNVIVEDFINVSHMMTLIESNGARKVEGVIRLENDLKVLYEKYHMLGMHLLHYSGNNSPLSIKCFCGSGKGYGDCHRIELYQMGREDKERLKMNLVSLQSFFV